MPRPRHPAEGERPAKPTVEVYADESNDQGGYDLIGSLWVTKANARRLRGIMAGIRDRFGVEREFKWVKASGSELFPPYKALAQEVTQYIWADRAHFHCLVLRRDTLRADHDADDRELQHYKYVHWLVRKRLEAGESYVLTLDHRTDKDSDRLPTLKRVLNRSARKDRGINYDCVRDVQARPSREDDLLQITDILLGAVAYHWAGSHRNPHASLAKCELAERIAHGIKKPNLAFRSSPHERRFNIWLWSPRGV